MKTQNTGDTVDSQATPPGTGGPKRNRWLAGIGAIIVVILVVGLSALVFAQLRQHQAGRTTPTTPTPPAAQWKQVLKGYTLTSIAAARNNPAVIYACVGLQVPGTASQSNPGALTILRSTDFGDHWQDVGSKAGLSSICQLTVNPADSDEIYVVSVASNSQRSSVLKHSIDGGQTWETIQPVLHVPDTQTPVSWSVQQIQLEDNHLFGMQWIIPRAVPENQPIHTFPNLLARLVTSVDGGHNWTIIDNYFTAQKLGLHSYAIDPTNPNTIYDLVGALLFPFRGATTNGPLPYTVLDQQLYKTTDGGTTWKLLLKDLPYGSQVQLASGNPRIIYVGGTISPLPLAPGMPKPSYPFEVGSFHLQVSTNAGSSWQIVAIPTKMQSIQNWYVSPDGRVYASPTLPLSGQPTAITGTVVPSTPIPVPTGNPQSGVPPIGQGASSVGTQFIAPSGVLTQAMPMPPSQFIRRYDPTTNSWSDVTRPPTPGFMLQLTPAQATSGAVLWFAGMTNNGEVMLYRYVV